jgi:carbamoyl-phosphate synthase large subunit
MKLFSNVLITGCGGDIGLGLCRILKKEGIVDKVVGCDIHSDHPAECVFDAVEAISPASNSQYFAELEQIIQKYGIDLIIPTSESEIYQFVSDCLFIERLDIPVLIASEKAVQIGLDKWATSRFLKDNDLYFPWTEILGDTLPNAIPCIVKMRSGQGSKDLLILEDSELVTYYQKKRPKDIWQELLLPDNEEYTCGLYRSRTKETRAIVIQRKLKGGLTGSGRVVQHSEIEHYLFEIASCLDLQGSINVQLRLTKRGPVAFEINPRFSSTVVFRHLLGFQDLIWAMQEIKNLTLEPYNKISPEQRIYSGACEYIIPARNCS